MPWWGSRPVNTIFETPSIKNFHRENAWTTSSPACLQTATQSLEANKGEKMYPSLAPSNGLSPLPQGALAEIGVGSWGGRGASVFPAYVDWLEVTIT